MPVRAEHVGAHGGRSAKLDTPASKMAHTYQIHVPYSYFGKNDEISSMDFKIESPNYGNQR